MDIILLNKLTFD